jgi:ATP-binding cassette, subfamily F, member 3
MRKTVRDAEADLAKLEVVKTAIDKAMFDPSAADNDYKSLTMGELSQRRAKIADAMTAAEARWMEATTALETQTPQ